MADPVDADRYRDLAHRKLVCIATAKYDNLPALEGVPDEVKVITDWLTDPQLGDRKFEITYPQLSKDPSVGAIREALSAEGWLGYQDAAVVYITGHGFTKSNKHYTAVRKTDKEFPTRTALTTEELVRLVTETEVEHLIVFVDLCYAGLTAQDVGTDALPSKVVLLGSVSDDQPAAVGGLTGAIQAFLQSSAGKYVDRYLAVHDFVDDLKQYLPANQELCWLNQKVSDLKAHPCLPNPHWRPEPRPPVAPARAAVALRVEDLASHWGPRSRGTTEDTDPGWLFTGRVRLMTRLISAATGEPGTLVVTGRAGSGKSAALARLVTLSDPGFRARYQKQLAGVREELLPEEGCVAVALLAKGRTPDETLGELIDLLGIPTPAGPATRAALITAAQEWLGGRPDPVTIVVDAIDESANPTDLLTGILAGLRSGPAGGRTRLILGLRSPSRDGQDTQADTRLELLAQQAQRLPAAELVAVDEDPWWCEQDLRDYASLVLTFPPTSPYRLSDPEPVARRLAGRAGRSFLITRLAAASLAAREHAVDPADDGWLVAVDQGVVGVFRDDLHEALPRSADRLRAVHLLRALALSQGRGLPWIRVWAVVANAVADDPTRYPDGQPPTYGDNDISWLMGTRLAGYLVTDREDGIPVYRLFHQTLTEVLADQWEQLLTPPTQQPCNQQP